MISSRHNADPFPVFGFSSVPHSTHVVGDINVFSAPSGLSASKVKRERSKRQDKMLEESRLESLLLEWSQYLKSCQRQSDHYGTPLTDHYLNASTKSNTNQQDFSSGLKQYSVIGLIKGIAVKALPDTGANMCFISPDLASRLGLRSAPGTEKEITLANRKVVQSPGMVEVPWRFARERKTYMLDCWILPGCVNNLILGNPFLDATLTLTKFCHRIKSKIVETPKRLLIRQLGDEKHRLWGYLDGHQTAALPDTGSDVMLIDSAYARKIGLYIDNDPNHLLEVEFADGTTAWTRGVVHAVPWDVGGKTVYCDFHVLDDLSVDVILSKDYLFHMNVFSEHADCISDVESNENLSHFCNIRLIGRYSNDLNILEELCLEDCELT